MILKKRYLPFQQTGNIFKIVADELSANVHTQIIICDDILKELEMNNCDYNVYFQNYVDDHDISEWYTLHEGHAFSPVISKLGVRSFGNNYSQVTRFYFRGYDFSGKSYVSEEFLFYEHEIQRILVIEVSY